MVQFHLCCCRCRVSTRFFQTTWKKKTPVIKIILMHANPIWACGRLFIRLQYKDHTQGCKDTWSVTSRFLWREVGKEIRRQYWITHKRRNLQGHFFSDFKFWSTKMCLMSPGTILLCVFSILVTLCGGLNLEDAGKWIQLAEAYLQSSNPKARFLTLLLKAFCFSRVPLFGHRIVLFWFLCTLAR